MLELGTIELGTIERSRLEPLPTKVRVADPKVGASLNGFQITGRITACK
jgi:hypothetical protein